jgi:ribosomal-protein-alanine N-acetyltransferase
VQEKKLSDYVRPMRREDVPQVNEIDREAFPTQWPPPSYERELRDAISHHIVVCDEAGMAPPPVVEPGGFSRLALKIKHWLAGTPSDGDRRAATERVLGFASLWIMADEAHLTNIAVRQAHRQQGIGTLLLISVVELASELKADFLTLEVRASNTLAQALYKKFGFAEVGVRRGYYTDNREDAVIMSTESIKTPSFQARFQGLKADYLKRNGHLPSLSTWHRNHFISAKPPSPTPHAG